MFIPLRIERLTLQKYQSKPLNASNQNKSNQIKELSSGIGCSEAAVLLLSADAVGAVVVAGLDVVLDGGGINGFATGAAAAKVWKGCDTS